MQAASGRGLYFPSSSSHTPGQLLCTYSLSLYSLKVFLHLVQVADRPVSSCAEAQGPVSAQEADLSLVKEMHAVFGAAPLLCVFCVSSLFPGLVDCSSEQHCTELAAALAVELIGQCMHKDRQQ